MRSPTASRRNGLHPRQPDKFEVGSGAPVAHEDHPQRALHAALAMQEELRRYADRLRAESKIPVEARVGVNTGEVVVRSIETGGHTEYTPVGHVTNLADGG